MGLSISYEHNNLPNRVYNNSLNDEKKCPIVRSIKPSFGGFKGGKPIRIFGENFVNMAGLACMFGSRFQQPARFISQTQIECPSPHTIPRYLMVSMVALVSGQKLGRNLK